MTESFVPRLAALTIATLPGLAGNEAQAAPRIELSTGTEYSSLDLGNSMHSTVLYSPFTTRLIAGNLSVRATIPYLSISAPADLLVLLDDDPTGSTAGRPNGPQARNTHVSGLGDSSFSATYSFNDIGTSPAYIDLNARVRLPTGNKNDGTGVGATDYSGGMESGVDLDRGGAYASGGRRILGSVAGLDRVNGWQASTGAWLNLGAVAVLGTYYDWRTASERGFPDTREVGAYLSYRLTQTWKLKVDGSTALEERGPNYTIALTIYWRTGGHVRESHD